MEALEVVFMVAALILMFAAVGAKVLTTQLIGRMNRHISQLAQVKSEAMGRLKGAQNQKAVIEQNQNDVLLSKKNKIAKKLNRLKKEMGTLQDEESQRKQRSSMRKVD